MQTRTNSQLRHPQSSACGGVTWQRTQLQNATWLAMRGASGWLAILVAVVILTTVRPRPFAVNSQLTIYDRGMAIRYLGDDTWRWTKRGRTPIVWIQLRLFGGAAPARSTVDGMAKKQPTNTTTNALGVFDGQNVIAATIAVTGAGDGLSQALAVAPAELHMGQQVDVVIRCRVASVKHVPTNKDQPGGDLARQHTLKAGLATIVEATLVNEVLAAQKKKLDEANGVVGLDAQVGEDWQ